MTVRQGHLADMAKGYTSPELEYLFGEGRERRFNTGDHLLTEGVSTDYFFAVSYTHLTLPTTPYV